MDNHIALDKVTSSRRVGRLDVFNDSYQSQRNSCLNDNGLGAWNRKHIWTKLNQRRKLIAASNSLHGFSHPCSFCRSLDWSLCVFFLSGFGDIETSMEVAGNEQLSSPKDQLGPLQMERFVHLCNAGLFFGPHFFFANCEGSEYGYLRSVQNPSVFSFFLLL